MTNEIKRTIPKDEQEIAEILGNMTKEEKARVLAMLTGMQVEKAVAEQNKSA